MKDYKTIEKFIELRAQRKSLASIAKELRISKQTAITWSNKYIKEIKDLSAIEREKLYEMYRMHKEERVTYLAKLLKKVRSEIDKRDFSALKTKELFELSIKITILLKTELEQKDDFPFDASKSAREGLENVIYVDLGNDKEALESLKVIAQK
jgi:hypothetical protein